MKRRDLLLGSAGLLGAPLLALALPAAVTRVPEPPSAAAVALADLGSPAIALVDARFTVARALAVQLGARGVPVIDIAQVDVVRLWRDRLEAECAAGATVAGLTGYADWQMLRGSATHLRPRAVHAMVPASRDALAAGRGTLFSWRLEQRD